MNTSKAVDIISHRPAWQVNRAVRRAGSTQEKIARAVGCNQSDVSKAINRKMVGTPLAGRIWAEIARVVTNGQEGWPPR